MSRGEVIGIDAIVELQLPIAAIGVGDAAGHELHAVGPLIHREIEEDAHLAQELGQRRHVPREAAEDEALVAFEARQRQEIVALRIEARRIEGGAAVLDGVVPAGAIVGPAVIGAGEVARIALLGTDDHRAFVAADIEESVDAVVGVARDDDGRARDPGRREIVGLRHLRFDGEEGPAPLEDEFALELEERGIGEDVAMHAEDTVIRAIIDQVAHVARSHVAASPTCAKGA
jgi:transcription elongation GreA/GreB family factor